MHKALEDYLDKNDIEDNSQLIQVWSKDKEDYSNVIYNRKSYEYDEVEEYMFKYVLRSGRDI